MEGKIKIGPVGNTTFKSATTVEWDEGSHNGIISQICLSHGSSRILSIQFHFVFDDKFVLSDRYGQNNCNMFDVILLNWPHEYIIGISGMHGDHYGTTCIKSLKFTTNTNEYGPFGFSSTTSLEKFDLKLGKFRQFGGFFGKCDVSGLQNIGVYLQPTTFKPKSRYEQGRGNRVKDCFGLIEYVMYSKTSYAHIPHAYFT